MAKLAPAVERALHKERDALLEKRRLAVAAIDEEIAQIDEMLGPPERAFSQGLSLLPTGSAMLSAHNALLAELSARELNKRAVEFCRAALIERSPMKTPELLRLVQLRGVELQAQNQEERLSQLLSARKDLLPK